MLIYCRSIGLLLCAFLAMSPTIASGDEWDKYIGDGNGLYKFGTYGLSITDKLSKVGDKIYGMQVPHTPTYLSYVLKLAKAVPDAMKRQEMYHLSPAQTF